MFVYYLEGSGDNWYLNSLKEWHPEHWRILPQKRKRASCMVIGGKNKCRC